jgi:hypothetical protein
MLEFVDDIEVFNSDYTYLYTNTGDKHNNIIFLNSYFHFGVVRNNHLLRGMLRIPAVWRKLEHRKEVSRFISRLKFLSFICLLFYFNYQFFFFVKKSIFAYIACSVWTFAPTIIISYLISIFLGWIIGDIILFFKKKENYINNIDDQYIPLTLNYISDEKEYKLYFPVYAKRKYLKMELLGTITTNSNDLHKSKFLKVIDNGNFFSIDDFEQDLSSGFFYRKLKLEKCSYSRASSYQDDKSRDIGHCGCHKDNPSKSQITYKEAIKIIGLKNWPQNLSSDLILTQKLYLKKES